MAVELGEAYVSIVPSTRGLGKKIAKEFGQVESAAATAGKEAGKKMSSGFSNAAKGMAKVAGGALAAVGAIGAGAMFSDAIKQAGDYEQSVGAINAVFKDQAAQMMGWAKTSSTAVGLSRNEYQELSTTLGALLKNGGTPLDELGEKTNNLVGLGADLASMFGGTTKDAVGALSSALKGERDPIEAYGVSLNQAKIEAKAVEMGLMDAGGEMSNSAQQAATLALIMDQTADSHGNFAKEADTFAGKQQRMGAQWADLKAKIGELFLPALSTAMGFVTGTALPALEEFTGGIRAFREAWKANDGDITSSGFPGFMERVAYEARQAFGYIKSDVIPVLKSLGGFLVDNKNALIVIAGGMLAYKINTMAATAATSILAAKQKLATLWTTRQTIAQKALNWALVTNPVGAVIIALTALVAGVIFAYKNIGWFKDGVDAAWSFIKTATASVFGWITNTAFPAVQSGLTWLGGAFTWLYEKIIKPVFDGIRMYIAVVAGIWMTIFDGVVWVVRKTLGPVFTWLYNNAIKPAFDGIRMVINAVLGWFTGEVARRWNDTTSFMGRVFSWLYNWVIAPVVDSIRRVIGVMVDWFTGSVATRWGNTTDFMSRMFTALKDGISAGWDFLRDKVFEPLIEIVRDKLGPAFEAAKDAVKRAWDKIQDIVKAPVKFVIDTVINGALIKNINKVLGTFGMDKIEEVSSGFRKGGYTGNGGKDEVAGVVHGREHVLRAESTASINKTNPGLLDAMNKYGAAAFGKYNPANAAVGDHVFGRPSFDGPAWENIARTGVLNISGSAPGWGLDRAIRVMDAATRINVRRGPYSGLNSAYVTARNYPQSWAGLYRQDDGNIALNNATFGHRSTRDKSVVAAHEIGHALGLPHAMAWEGGNGAYSIMNYDTMFRAGGPTAADVSALSAIYGGKGNAGVSPVSDSGGGRSGLLDLLLSGVSSLFDKMASQFKGLAGDIAIGAGKFLLSNARDWVGKKADDVWDAPVGTTHALKPGVSSIYNGTGRSEYFQRVEPGSSGSALTVENIREAIAGMPVHMQTDQGVVIAKLAHAGQKRWERR